MVLTQELINRYNQYNGYVYLIHAEGTNRYKIGRSVNPMQRFETLKKQSPYPLKIVKVVWSGDSHFLEKRLHKIHKNERTYGEWFEFEEQTSIEMLFEPIVRSDLKELVLGAEEILKTEILTLAKIPLQAEIFRPSEAQENSCLGQMFSGAGGFMQYQLYAEHIQSVESLVKEYLMLTNPQLIYCVAKFILGNQNERGSWGDFCYGSFLFRNLYYIFLEGINFNIDYR